MGQAPVLRRIVRPADCGRNRLSIGTRSSILAKPAQKENEMKELVLAPLALLQSATSALACAGAACPPPTNVPEISALEGTAAIAALLAVVLFVWERRRRAA